MGIFFRSGQVPKLSKVISHGGFDRCFLPYSPWPYFKFTLRDIAADNISFKVINKIEDAVSKAITNDYGQEDKKRFTEAIDKAQQEVRNLFQPIFFC